MRAPVTKKAKKEPAQAKTLIVEWKIAEDDHEWHVAQTETPAAPAPAYHWGRRWWVASAVALFFLLAAGGWLRHQAHAGLNQIEGELQAAVEAGQWRAQPDSRMDGKHSSELQNIVEGGQLPGAAHVQILDLRETWAIVQVTTIVARPLGPAQQEEFSYRQTRLYRRGESGWYAAAPSAALWGEPRTLETTYFIFHYYALDSEAVAEAAVKLDAIYPDLAASYPLALAGDGKRQIRVSPEYTLEGIFNKSADAALEIASPAIYLAPTALSEGDILAQAVFLNLLEVLTEQRLTRQLLPDRSYDYEATSRVYMLLESLRLWQLWSTELPLASLHKPTIQWIYSDVQGKRVPPAFDATLCSLHQLWRAAPAIQIPLFCGDTQQMERYEVGRYLPLDPPRSLAEIHLFATMMPDEPSRGLGEAERVGVATLFDYAATTYGRQSLAKLIANADFLSTWETLIPATFGVPYTDFERGWQAHLRNDYGVSVSVTP